MRMRKIARKNKGNTLVSVIVGFVMLLIGISMLYTSFQFASTIANRAENTRIAVDAVLEAYYTQPTTATVVKEDTISNPFSLTYTIKKVVKGEKALYFFEKKGA